MNDCTMPGCEEPVADGRARAGLCQSHLDRLGDGDANGEADARGHENPIDQSDVTDEERAGMLLDYLDRIREEFGTTPLLMPLGEEGKAPWITDRCSLDSAKARRQLVDGYEAARRIHHEGARGFAMYAGRRNHGTAEIAFVDHDHPDAFPAPTAKPTLEVLTGSGRGPHETYRNDPNDPVRNARVGDNDGEMRAENWYVITPGSIHPSGGVYHITEDRDIATISDSDLTDRERPSTALKREATSDAARAIQDADGSSERPDDGSLEARLEAAFDNPHDGGRIEQVYNGRYASAGFDDRSSAEFWLANRLDSWVGCGNEARVERAMDRGNLQKWSERTDRNYRDSVLAGVGTQDWYYDPEHRVESDAESAYGRQILATLPNSPRTQAAANGRQWTDDRDADADADGLTQQDVYDRVRETIDNGMARHDSFVLDAIMGSGKTYNFFGALADRGEQGAYFAPRIELYEQAVEYAAANGIPREECYILPSIKRHCQTWAGEHGEDQEHLVKTLYYRGVQPKTIHNLLGDELGCCEDGKCEYEHRCDFDEDEYQVLIGHYAHAHLPHVTGGRHCAFDEDPASAFTTRVEGPDLIRGVNAFLDLQKSPPFDGWDDLIQHRNDRERREAGLAWFDRPEFEFEPDERNAVRFEEEGFHAYAPLAVYTILAADPLKDGYPFETTSLPGFGNTGQFFSTSGEHGEHYVEVSDPPELEYADAIIALDGTPLVDDGIPIEWKNALNYEMGHRRVLSDGDRTGFLAETQGNAYIQTSEHINPYSSGRYNDATEDAALLAAVREAYGDGDPPVVFTDKKVREEYEQAGFVEQGLAETFDHPGNLRGSDEYGSTRLAVQLGSSHHGDHEVRRRAAMLGETVAPEGRGVDRDYGSELGNKLVYQMREAQSAQNALRVGRDGQGALFVFDTCAFPDWIPVEDGVADVSTWSSAEQTIREAWSEELGRDHRERGVSTAAVSEAVGVAIGERHVRTCLNRLAARGYLQKIDDPADGRRMLWADSGLAAVDEHQGADVDLPEMNTESTSTGADVPEERGSNSQYVKSPQLRLNQLDMSARDGKAGTDPPGVARTPSDGRGESPPESS